MEALAEVQCAIAKTMVRSLIVGDGAQMPKRRFSFLGLEIGMPFNLSDI